MTAGSALYTPQSDNLIPKLSTDGSSPASAGLAGYTLPPGTWYFPLGSSEGPISAEAWIMSFQIKFSAALAATFTLESTNFPATIQGNGQGAIDVKDWDTTTGNWIQENPSTATVFTAGGANNTVSNLTLVAGGTNVGGMTVYLSNAAARRYRVKAVVTVQGTARTAAMGKD